MNELSQTDMVPIGQSGIYCNPSQTAEVIHDWVNNTSEEERINKIAQIATLGLASCLVTLLIISLIQKN